MMPLHRYLLFPQGPVWGSLRAIPVQGLLLAMAALMLWVLSLGQALAVVRVAVTGGPTDAAVEKAAELARSQGVDVKLLTFSDWITPNTAVAHGDADVNYFQHRPFLANAEREGGFTLTPIAFGIDNVIGLYSNTLKRAQDIQDGGRVAIADDPVNLGRGLHLLQDEGLIKLAPNAGANASIMDIAQNPRHLRFVELPGPQLARALPDVDIAEGYPASLIGAGLKNPTDALAFSHDDDRTYALVFAVRPADVKRKDINTFIHIYQTAPEVREILARAYGSPRLYRLAWLDKQGNPTVTPAEATGNDTAKGAQ